jgi:hypothetical protein
MRPRFLEEPQSQGVNYVCMYMCHKFRAIGDICYLAKCEKVYREGSFKSPVSSIKFWNIFSPTRRRYGAVLFIYQPQKLRQFCQGDMIAKAVMFANQEGCSEVERGSTRNTNSEHNHRVSMCSHRNNVSVSATGAKFCCSTKPYMHKKHHKYLCIHYIQRVQIEEYRLLGCDTV